MAKSSTPHTQHGSFQSSLHYTRGQILELPFEQLLLKVINFYKKYIIFEVSWVNWIHFTTQESKSHGAHLLVHLLEKEKKSLELIISSQQAQEHALKTHIQHLQDELENQDSMVCTIYLWSYFPSIRSDPTTDSEFLIYL